ncbi:MAG: hypothetical protein BGO98_02445 [Myxococcales bacterium 68-20]|nr:hypothetical protein [Myxococcales bacterium]OJY21708.1 MAG: hypothetical protein BGO98_02445 [Myxococcales bacterium 68-20]
MASAGWKRLSSFGLAGAVFVATYAGVFACSSTETSFVEEDEPVATDAGFDTKPSAESGLGVLTFMPETSYSGHDGTHTFTVPVAVYDSADDLKVTADDPAAAEVVPKVLANPVRTDGTTDNGKYFFVVVKKPGTIKLTATSQGKSATSTITVAEYSTARWTAGETRYKNGGGGDPPCTDCHVNGKAIDHSPAALATASDEKIAVVITTGISTHGFPIKIDNTPGHRWTVTDEERDGLVTYLRSLEPKGFK